MLAVMLANYFTISVPTYASYCNILVVNSVRYFILAPIWANYFNILDDIGLFETFLLAYYLRILAVMFANHFNVEIPASASSLHVSSYISYLLLINIFTINILTPPSLSAITLS